MREIWWGRKSEMLGCSSILCHPTVKNTSLCLRGVSLNFNIKITGLSLFAAFKRLSVRGEKNTHSSIYHAGTSNEFQEDIKFTDLLVGMTLFFHPVFSLLKINTELLLEYFKRFLSPNINIIIKIREEPLKDCTNYKLPVNYRWGRLSNKFQKEWNMKTFNVTVRTQLVFPQTRNNTSSSFIIMTWKTRAQSLRLIFDIRFKYEDVEKRDVSPTSSMKFIDWLI